MVLDSRVPASVEKWRATKRLGCSAAALLLTAIAAFFAPLLVSAAHAQDAPPVMRLSSANQPPYLNADGTGVLRDVLDAMFERIGFDIELIDLPPRRAMVSANAGLHDGDAVRIKLVTDFFENLLVVDPPLYTMDFLGMHIDPDITVKVKEDLKKYSVGNIRGWRYAEARLQEHPDVVSVEDADTLFRLLQEGRIQVALFARAPGLRLIARKGYKNVMFTEFFDRRGMHVLLHKRHSGLVGPLGDALREMRQDGTLAEITAGREF